MLVHLFGATSSPCCASKQEDSKRFWEFAAQTVDTVNRNFYVNDCLKSVATVPEASRLASQLVQLLARGGFHLNKFWPIREHRSLLTWIWMTCLLTVLWAPSGTWKQTRLVLMLTL